MSSTDMPVALAEMSAAADAASTASVWAETVITVMFTVTAVLFVSFLAVVTGLA